MIQILKRILKTRNHKYTSKYKINDVDILNTICEKNRSTLKKVKKWLISEVAEKSYFQYGVPDDIKTLLDLDIGNELTYTDLIAYYSRLFNTVNYLELGVSVGKNFLQLAEQFENAIITGYDIENINPVLESFFEFKSVIKWATPSQSIRKEDSSLKQYLYKTNHVKYLAGDIWDESTWEKLYGGKFNVIFSDALHDPKALLWEFEMMSKYDLLNDKFIIFWDDLNNGLKQSFFYIAKQSMNKYGVTRDNIHLIKINGWLGQNYPIKHDVGFISNLDLY
jgi:hypothetical protein